MDQRNTQPDLENIESDKKRGLMAKFTKYQKLAPTERQKLMIYLCEAITSLKNSQEAAKLLSDLLSPQESQMLAKRLRIAKLLTEGKSYEDIRSALKVSYSTIARVNTWLNLSGEGYKIVIKRTRDREEKVEDPQDIYDPLSWRNVKRRYTLYFWPQLMLEELFKESDKKHQEKLVSILQRMEVKSRTFRDINKDIYESYKNFGKSKISNNKDK